MKMLYMFLGIMVFAVVITPAALFSQSIRNEGPDDVCISNIMDVKGHYFAALFVLPGQTMTLKGGKVIKGGGYYKALPGEHYYIPFGPPFCGLNVDRIQWNDTGKTVSIEGLQAFVDAENKIQILSDVKNPNLVDGILHLKLEGRSNIDYMFKIVFGQGISIIPPLFQAEKRDSSPQKR